MARPRAADDFPAIRARLEELRRERARADGDTPRTAGLRPNGMSSRGERADKPELPPAIRRVLSR